MNAVLLSVNLEQPDERRSGIGSWLAAARVRCLQFQGLPQLPLACKDQSYILLTPLLHTWAQQCPIRVNLIHGTI